ncbi:MAG: hypothetical protein M1820_008236 [Bogoriella megaspora]|nr:MAG: hypothetical protein M1820_008236 [Bogoriella megaspora]
MANPPPSQLPSTAADWKACMSTLQLSSDQTIHKYSQATSASEIKFPQYLLLRVLYLDSPPASVLLKDENKNHWIGKNNYDKARDKLKNISSWRKYLEYKDPFMGRGGSGQSGYVSLSLGAFSLVYYYQQQVISKTSRNNEHSTSKLDFTPISKRLRSQNMTAASRSAPPATPKSNPGGVQPLESGTSGVSLDDNDFTDRFGELGLGSLNTPGSSSVILSPTSPAKYPGLHDKAIEDEQIVNTCLLLFLHAVSIHIDGLTSEWTLHRRSFQLKSGPHDSKVFEARVDGYLRKKDGTASAVIEVKPYIRGRHRSEIRMQEAAQLASWICNEPHKNIMTPTNEHMRLLISQDRHEVYLSFAEFDSDYIDYILGQNTEKLSFLRIREFGPFEVQTAEHMEKLSRLVLAYMFKVS